jgi:hypothetical protein
MKTAQNVTLIKLKQKKNLSGGFAWFEVPKTEYITRHILAGLTPFETK